MTPLLSTLRRAATTPLLVLLAASCSGELCSAGTGAGATCGGPGTGGSTDEGLLAVTTLVQGLDTPWDLAWGPDGAIWVSERGGRISRVDPSTGARTTAGTLDAYESGESGLMGLAFDPHWAQESWVYAAYTAQDASGARTNRVVRMRWANGALGAPQLLVGGIPAGSIHDGSRLAFGPDGYLYVTTGDAGSPEFAQDRASLGGKILRMTETGTAAPGNPFGTLVYSYGHRNPQGLVFQPGTNRLFEVEHGPSDNDEVNVITAGGNYGWPTVHGFCDDDVGAERAFCQANAVVEPIRAWTPTIAPAGATFYDATRIAGWRGSLLFTTLGGQALYRLTLAADGRSATGVERLFGNQFGRLRDVLVGPDGVVYLATSNRDGRGSPTDADDRIIRVDAR